MPNLISIAKVLKPQGIKGELKCKSLTEKTDVFSNLTSVYCDNKKINVVSSVFRLGYAYIMLENIKTRNDAELFRNKTFFIEQEQYGELDENSYYIEDLIGCKIHDEQNNFIGEVTEVENFGATDILSVKEEWATYSVPFLSKIFIDVDVENQKLIVDKNAYQENRVY